MVLYNFYGNDIRKFNKPAIFKYLTKRSHLSRYSHFWLLVIGSGTTTGLGGTSLLGVNVCLGETSGLGGSDCLLITVLLGASTGF